MSLYTLHLNGRLHEVEADPAMPLLWLLRDRLGLPGTKYGCGAGHCGACTVHLDGAAALSCVTPVAAVGARRVVTIEGLEAALARPLRQAWLELDVPQCGYCQGGQIMAAAALLRTNPKPSDADIDAALADNLCRCGTYLRIRAGVRRAAAVLREGRS